MAHKPITQLTSNYLRFGRLRVYPSNGSKRMKLGFSPIEIKISSGDAQQNPKKKIGTGFFKDQFFWTQTGS